MAEQVGADVHLSTRRAVPVYIVYGKPWKGLGYYQEISYSVLENQFPQKILAAVYEEDMIMFCDTEKSLSTLKSSISLLMSKIQCVCTGPWTWIRRVLLWASQTSFPWFWFYFVCLVVWLIPLFCYTKKNKKCCLVAWIEEYHMEADRANLLHHGPWELKVSKVLIIALKRLMHYKLVWPLTNRWNCT